MLAYYIVVGYLVGASLIGLIPATLARAKGRSFAAWWGVSFLLLGIFAIIPVALLSTHRCPSCREVVNPSARVCWRCGTTLRVATPSGPVATGWTRQELRDEITRNAVIGTVLMVITIVFGVIIFGELPLPGGVAVLSCLILYCAVIMWIVTRPLVMAYRHAPETLEG